MIILSTFSLLLTWKQSIGDPIKHIMNGIPWNIIDTYYWIHSTFIVPNCQDKDVPHPGLVEKYEENEVP